MLVHTRIWPHRFVAQYTHHHVHDVTTAIDEQWRSTGRQKGSELHHRGEFVHSYYTFESVSDADHDGVGSQKLCRPSLRAVRFLHIATYMTSQLRLKSNGDLREAKRARNSTTEVSFCTIITRLSQCLTVITTV